MTNPVPGRSITTAYGIRGRHWSCNKNSQGGQHTGADWAAPSGTPIVAPIAGTIRHRNYGQAFGPYQFAISPSEGQPFANGEVFFGHVLDRLPDGTEVQIGQRISSVGALGGATGPHLHMEYMPNSKGRWACGLHADPAPVVNAGGGGGAPYVTKDIYTSKLGFGQRDSDSVKELQERLNRIKLQGGANLPVTGNFLTMTGAEVAKWQEQVCGDRPDAPGREYLGPKQARRMFPADIYTLHDDGPPAIAGGGGGTPPPVQPPTPPPAVAWFAAPSLVVLRDEVNARWPDRSTASDGTIGDYQHSTSKSEHNPVGTPFGPEFGTPGCVHAMDITAEGIDPQRVLDAAIGDERVWYVIFSGSIWSKTYAWEQRPYTGSNPHTTHIHISLAADDQASAVRNEGNTVPWIEPTGDYVTREEYVADLGAIADAVRKAAEEG